MSEDAAPTTPPTPDSVAPPPATPATDTDDGMEIEPPQASTVDAPAADRPGSPDAG
jgi:hypothetical protein